MPPIILFGWDFMNAMYTPLADKPIMDMTNIFPATPCRREPLRKEIAKAPERSPTMPEQIWRSNMGENFIFYSIRLLDPSKGPRT